MALRRGPRSRAGTDDDSGGYGGTPPDLVRGFVDEVTWFMSENKISRADLMARELGISVTFVAAHGDPYHEITRVAMETRADAIVVGASLKAGHRLMGSLAVRLVRAGKWPVTVVP